MPFDDMIEKPSPIKHGFYNMSNGHTGLPGFNSSEWYKKSES
jgi:hypothetical protein